MTWRPISGAPVQYQASDGSLASGYYLKFYQSGTTTAISMATDSTGGTTLAKCQLNASGYPINGSSDVFIPHVNQKYKIVLYTNSTDADADTTGNADWVIDAVDQTFVDEWNTGYTASRSDTDTFTIAGQDVSSVFRVGRKVKLTGGAVRFATISAVSYATDTTVDVIWITDSSGVPSTLNASMNTAYVSILSDDVYPDAIAEPLQYVRSLSELRNINPVNTRRVRLNYHTNEGDSGGGIFRAVSGASASTYTEDYGVTIIPSGGDGSAAWIREYEGDVNAHWFGAQGDGSTNDATALQRWLDYMVSVKAAGGAGFAPAGSYLTDTKLTVAAGSGPLVIRGAGAYIGNPQTGTRKGSATIFYWNGAASGTMFETTGTSGVRVQDLTMVGRTTGAGNQAGILWNCLGGSGGFGSGLELWDNVTFSDAAVAIQYANAQSDTNAADCYFGKLQFTSCTDCVVIKNDQGVNYVFDMINADSCNRVIYAARGGKIRVNWANLSACGGATSTDWCFQFDALNDNVGPVQLNGITIEQNTQQLLKFGDLGHVVLTNFTEAQSDQNVTMVDVNGGFLTCRNSRFVTNDATNPFFNLDYGSGSQRYAVIIEECHFDVTTWDIDSWFTYDVNTQTRLLLQRNQYGDSIELEVPFVNSVLEWGPVTHKAQTTDATLTTLSFDGATSNTYNVCEIPDDTYWLIDAYVVGAQSDGSTIGTFHRRGTFKNVGGTLSLVGSTQTVGTDNNAATYGTIDIIANDATDSVRVTVTGLAATTINWSAKIVGTRVRAD